MTAMRLDKWLWMVRVFKTRALATEACRLGRVNVEGARAKPARDIECGMVVTFSRDSVQRTLRVTALPRQRIGARLILQFYDDLTPPEEWERARREREERRLSQPDSGATPGRPEKFQRRQLQRFLDSLNAGGPPADAASED